MTQEKSNKFQLLEAGRGFAALLVVVLHTRNMMAQPRFFNTELLGGYLGNFNVGVDFFFVLSGFIIAWVHWGDIGNRQRIGNYATKRFLRIYPPYWGILIPLIVLYLIFPRAGIPSQHDPVNIVLSVFLAPYTSQPVLGVAWTLTHEIFFYLLFGIIIYLGRNALLVLPVWAVAIVAANLSGPLDYPLSFFLSPFNLEFIMGIAAGALLRRYSIPAPRVMLVVSAAVFIAIMVFAHKIQDNNLFARIAFGIPAMVFVLAAVEIDRAKPIPVPKFALLLGAASYSIYLIHPVALSFMTNALSRIHFDLLPIGVAALIIFLVGVAVGVIYHLLFEKRLMNLFRNLLNAWFGQRKPSTV
jgi:exopolysaccharide production protein ExoZ